MSERPTSTREVVHWSEYKAFAKRLGIPKLLDQKLTIELQVDCNVIVTQTYLGTDEDAPA